MLQVLSIPHLTKVRLGKTKYNQYDAPAANPSVHQFLELEAVCALQRLHLYPEPLFASGVVQNLGLEALQGIVARSESLRIGGWQRLQGLFQPARARLSLFLEFFQPKIVEADKGTQPCVRTGEQALIARHIQPDSVRPCVADCLDGQEQPDIQFGRIQPVPQFRPDLLSGLSWLAVVVNQPQE